MRKVSMRGGALGAVALAGLLAALAPGGPLAADGGGQALATFERARAVLERSCVGCHGAEEPKNDYRLDTRKAAVAGGKLSREGGAIVVGDSAKSRLILFVEADRADEEAEVFPMPPRKRNPKLSAADIQTLKAWIDAGAPWPDGVVLKPRKR